MSSQLQELTQTQTQNESQKLDIKINQSILSILGRKLYQSNFGYVILRELIQNALDANATQIDVTYNDLYLTVTDNGCGIDHIPDLLNVIGGALKLDNIETIGGYGLAKLAIFGCREWEFLSISGSFSTGFMYNPSRIQPSGTTVTCIFSADDVNWNYESRIKSYLESIARNVNFTFNGKSINPVQTKTESINNHLETFGNTSDNGYAVVRVNGLPTFNQYISNLQETIFIDYTVSCNPYDATYPLTSNRDGFIESSAEFQDLKNRIQSIQTKLETDKKMSENICKSKTQITWRGKRYISGGNITKQDYENSAMAISTYERYLKQIAKEFYRNSEINSCSFGLTDSSDDEAGMYSPSLQAFFLSKHVSNKGDILAIAMHEFTHFLGYGTIGHDQNFASKLADVTGRILNRIFDGEFRK
jgi:hypothetical protein